MNQIETRRWQDSLEFARSATSAVADDFGYLEPPAAAEPRGSLWLLLSTWRERARARRQLARIPARDLKDAGLTAEAAAFELAQPFWRPLSVGRK